MCIGKMKGNNSSSGDNANNCPSNGNGNGNAADETLDSGARGKALVCVVAYCLEQMTQSNETKDPNFVQSGKTEVINRKFHTSRIPTISIRDYLLRIEKYSRCSPECFVMALIYIDRFVNRNDGYKLTRCNIHRIVITSVVLAAKFFDDEYFNNAYYAKVGGLPCAEMNSLELEFLFLVEFSLHVTEEEYSQYYNQLANHNVFLETLKMLEPKTIKPVFDCTNITVRHYIAEDPRKDYRLTYFTSEETRVPPPNTSPSSVNEVPSIYRGVDYSHSSSRHRFMADELGFRS